MSEVTYEQVIDVIRALPEERLGSLYDFALFLRARSSWPDDFEDIFGETPEEIEADEAQWTAQFQRTGEKLRRLSEEAAEEYDAGRTMPLEFDDEGRPRR